METTELDAYLPFCPARNVLGVLTNKWTALVTALLADRPHRFGELRRRVEGISQKVLTQILRGLERDGLVSRTVLPTSPPSVEYALTPLGAEMAELLVTLKDWSQARYEDILAARAKFDGEATP